MTSTGKEIWNDEESIKGREPTEKDMRIIFPSEAKKLWGQSASRVSGTSMLVNDPNQFLDHYYHFAAELLVGLWKTYASLDPTINAQGVTHLPSPSRMLFPHVPAGRWNDYAKMNSFLSRAIFPSMSYEYQDDFLDRADTARAFAFERVVFADRAAAFRGPNFQKTWRTASEAVTLQTSKYWWTPIRKNLLEFVGRGRDDIDLDQEILGVGVEVGDGSDRNEIDIEALEAEEGAMDEEKEELMEEISRKKQAKSGKPVITYVSRQEWGRRMLQKQGHESLVRELQELEKKYGWEVNIVSMDKLSRDEQIRLAARTTVSRPWSPACLRMLMADHDGCAWKRSHPPLVDERPEPTNHRHRVLLPRRLCRRLRVHRACTRHQALWDLGRPDLHRPGYTPGRLPGRFPGQRHSAQRQGRSGIDCPASSCRPGPDSIGRRARRRYRRRTDLDCWLGRGRDYEYDHEKKTTHHNTTTQRTIFVTFSVTPLA